MHVKTLLVLVTPAPGITLHKSTLPLPKAELGSFSYRTTGKIVVFR